MSITAGTLRIKPKGCESSASVQKGKFSPVEGIDIIIIFIIIVIITSYCIIEGIETTVHNIGAYI